MWGARVCPQGSIFYREPPEYEEFDRQRRERGGVNPCPGSIDRHCGQPNIAAAGADSEMCWHLEVPEMVEPQALRIFLREKAKGKAGAQMDKI
jgi:hypothetical protein